jgi:hypothetical protein
VGLLYNILVCFYNGTVNTSIIKNLTVRFLDPSAAYIHRVEKNPLSAVQCGALASHVSRVRHCRKHTVLDKKITIPTKTLYMFMTEAIQNKEDKPSSGAHLGEMKSYSVRGHCQLPMHPYRQHQRTTSRLGNENHRSHHAPCCPPPVLIVPCRPA